MAEEGRESFGKTIVKNVAASFKLARNKTTTVETEITEKIQSHYGVNEHKPTLFASLIVAHPRSCFAFWCCFYFIFTLLFTILLAIGGLDPLPTDRISEVNLNLPFEETTMRTQAFLRAQHIADYGAVTYNCRQSDPSGGYVTVFANAEDGENVLTKKGLEYLKEVEEHIMNTKDFANYCYLNTAECDEDTETSSTVLKTSSTCCVYLIENVTDSNGCFLAQSTTYWFNKYGDPNFDHIEDTIQLIKQTSDTDYANFQANLLKEFPKTGKSQVSRSGFYLGIPQHEPLNSTISANNDDDCDNSCKDEELTSIEKWCYNKLDTYLSKRFEDKTYNILYSYSGYDPLETQIFIDLSLALVGIVAVYCYTTAMLKSLFLGSCVMFQIFMSFFGGNLVYRYLWPTEDGFGYKYFTLFQALTIFIIIGVGCDDCFVFHGVWAAGEGHYKDEVQRLSASRAHANKAMLVTTITTAASFFSNLQSEFPLIAAFGTYAALLVLVNFAMVTTYFPSAVMFHYTIYGESTSNIEKKNKKKNDKKNGKKSNKIHSNEIENELKNEIDNEEVSSHNNTNNILEIDTEREVKEVKSISISTQESSSSTISSIRTKCLQNKEIFQKFSLSNFMANTYAPWVFKYRYFILGGSTLFMIGALFLSSMVVPVPFYMYTLFPPGTNFHDMLYMQQIKMSTLSSPLYAYITFGLNTNRPLEYSKDFKAYKFEFGSEGSGSPVFDTQFDITEPLTQLQMLETCSLIYHDSLDNSGLKINENYGINPQLESGELDTRGGEFGIQCPFAAMAKYVDTATWNHIEGTFSAPMPSGGEWDDEDDDNCKHCFANFTVASPPNNNTGTSYATSSYGYNYPVVPNVIWNTSNIIDGCDCGGVFPVPRSVCLDELEYLKKGTKFRCFYQGESAFYHDLQGFFNVDDNYDWWKDYVYATKTRNGGFDRMVMNYVKVQTTLSSNDNDFTSGLDFIEKWDKWANRYNKYMKKLATEAGLAAPTEALVYIPAAVNWVTSSRLAPNAISNTITSLCLAFLVVLLATFNWIITCMSIFIVGCIVTVIFACFKIFGWELGILESILCVIVVGFSVDFTIHLADAYEESDGENGIDNKINTVDTAEAIRYRKVRNALKVTGVSIISGGASTLLGTFSMMLAKITFFSRFGIVMFLTMTLSTLFSLLPFAAALMVIGPLGTEGMLSEFYGPVLEKAYNKLEAQRLKALATIPNSPLRAGSGVDNAPPISL